MGQHWHAAGTIAPCSSHCSVRAAQGLDPVPSVPDDIAAGPRHVPVSRGHGKKHERPGLQRARVQRCVTCWQGTGRGGSRSPQHPQGELAGEELPCFSQTSHCGEVMLLLPRYWSRKDGGHGGLWEDLLPAPRNLLGHKAGVRKALALALTTTRRHPGNCVLLSLKLN